jgi:hypothetical protein
MYVLVGQLVQMNQLVEQHHIIVISVVLERVLQEELLTDLVVTVVLTQFVDIVLIVVLQLHVHIVQEHIIGIHVIHVLQDGMLMVLGVMLVLAQQMITLNVEHYITNK